MSQPPNKWQMNRHGGSWSTSVSLSLAKVLMNSLRRGLQFIRSTRRNSHSSQDFIDDPIDRTLYLEEDNEDNNSGSPAPVIESDPKVINWTEALDLVYGDLNFLEEIFDDIIDSIQETFENFEYGFETKELSYIWSGAERMQGIACYFGFDTLRKSSTKILRYGGDRPRNNQTIDEIIHQIQEKEYPAFKIDNLNLKNEIEKWKENKTIDPATQNGRQDRSVGAI
jgi:hypothetical protein